MRSLGRPLDGPAHMPPPLRTITMRSVQLGAWLASTSSSILRRTCSESWGRGTCNAACQFTGTKILSWAMNLTWLESAQARGFDEVILLNERGEVAECTSANLFIANGSHVYTPPLSSGCLPGITREVLLGEVRAPGIRVEEKALLPGDLEAADEVFITSTTRDLLSVFQIEDKQIGRAGHTRQALARAFSEYVGNYVATHKEVAV